MDPKIQLKLGFFSFKSPQKVATPWQLTCEPMFAHINQTPQNVVFPN